MKKLFCWLCILLSGLLIYTMGRAKTGDTTHVVVMDKYLWTYNGFQDRWTKFPDSTKSYEKILLRYQLTCPTGGCGEWDYTTGIVLRKHTGRLDSTLQDAPSYTVNGSTPDSIRISHDTTYTFSYNKTKKKTDTTVNNPYKIYFYRDPNHAFQPTDSLFAWKAAYWNYIYDNTGKAVDSMFISGDSTLYLTKKKAYYVFEVIIPYEITRYITPYGKGFAKDWTRTWTMDVSDFAFLLHDSVELRSYYDGYTQGSLYTLSFDFIEGTPPRKTYRADLIYNGYFIYGNPDDPINNHLPATNIFFEPKADLITLRLTVSGHGSDQNGACEFIDKTHSILVNGTERYQQHLWRDNCNLNYTYPQTGTYWFSRAGWCPGDLVFPWDYDLGGFSKKGDSLTVKYQMDDYESPNPSGGYNVHGIVFYSTGPSFNTDAAIDDIIQPNNDPRFERSNPICPKYPPIITIHNNGKLPLTSLVIHYGVDGNEDHTYQWIGNLKFLEKAEVTLPAMVLDVGTHTFSASCVGGLTGDEYSNNDRVTSTYTMASGFSNKIAIAVKTDQFPDVLGISNNIRYELKNGNGDVIFSKKDLSDATQYRDTLGLANGCYSFTIYDDGEHVGLYPWAYQVQNQPAPKNGGYSLRDDKNVYIVNRTAGSSASGFGGFETTTFFVGTPSGVSEAEHPTSLALSVFPNPTSQRLQVMVGGIASIQATLTVHSILGQQVMATSLTQPTSELDISKLTPGTYILRVQQGDVVCSKTIQVQ
ncbi:MAG TPA: peptide-N-glycosidase F-related protein [Candidatus Kapabacteria bacterium]|nr:peptide-N-glycosidase F-related protein [Candidatus Kapabacteria bacterium]